MSIFITNNIEQECENLISMYTDIGYVKKKNPSELSQFIIGEAIVSSEKNQITYRPSKQFF